MLLSTWQLSSKIFMCDRTHEHQAQRVLFAGVGLDMLDQPLVVRLELLQRAYVQRASHTVTNDGHCRLDVGDLFAQL